MYLPLLIRCHPSQCLQRSQQSISLRVLRLEPVLPYLLPQTLPSLPQEPALQARFPHSK
jgi:hypothetical protein